MVLKDFSTPPHKELLAFSHILLLTPLEMTG